MPGPEACARVPLFDRLVDEHPGQPDLPGPLRTLDRAGLLESVRRELERLLSSRSPLPAHRLAGRELTVIDYGIPDLADFPADGPEDHARLAAVIERAVAAFEPRLRDVRVRIERPLPERRSLALALEGVLATDRPGEPVSFPTVLSLGRGEAEVGAARYQAAWPEEEETA
jgi:type VI secretion system protein ImpF